MNNRTVIEKFYNSFAASDAEGMVQCYHDDVRFEDPAFGILHGEDARNMWRMLVERGKGGLKVIFDKVVADEKNGRANWEAGYLFSPTGRRVLNKISADFEFKDGKIIRHTDRFDLWKWSAQALGWKGYALGWTSFMKNKIQSRSKNLLQAYIKKKG